MAFDTNYIQIDGSLNFDGSIYQWNQLFTIPSDVSVDALFGSGVDGDVIINANTTLTRNMEYNNLTIATTRTLNTAGFTVKVLGTLTIQGTGVIGCPGNAGSGTTGGVVKFTHNHNGPNHTGSGGRGGTPGSAGAGIGTAGTGPNVTFSNNNAPYSWRRGGGGGGGAFWGNPTGSTQATNGGATAYGAKGGNGGSASTTGGNVNYVVGGAGGGGGGVLELWAYTIDNANATNGINCNGGAGYGGATSGTEKSGNGGGGGGGCCIVYYHSETGSGLNGNPKAAGGAAGTGGNGGVAGSTGTALALQI